MLKNTVYTFFATGVLICGLLFSCKKDEKQSPSPKNNLGPGQELVYDLFEKDSVGSEIHFPGIWTIRIVKETIKDHYLVKVYDEDMYLEGEYIFHVKPEGLFVVEGSDEYIYVPAIDNLGEKYVEDDGSGTLVTYEVIAENEIADVPAGKINCTKIKATYEDSSSVWEEIMHVKGLHIVQWSVLEEDMRIALGKVNFNLRGSPAIVAGPPLLHSLLKEKRACLKQGKKEG